MEKSWLTLQVGQISTSCDDVGDVANSSSSKNKGCCEDKNTTKSMLPIYPTSTPCDDVSNFSKGGSSQAGGWCEATTINIPTSSSRTTAIITTDISNRNLLTATSSTSAVITSGKCDIIGCTFLGQLYRCRNYHNRCEKYLHHCPCGLETKVYNKDNKMYIFVLIVVKICLTVKIIRCNNEYKTPVYNPTACSTNDLISIITSKCMVIFSQLYMIFKIWKIIFCF